MEQTVTVERMAYSTDAVAHLSDGKTVFIPQAAPGDTVSIEIVEDKGSFARGRIVCVEEISPSGSRRRGCTIKSNPYPYRKTMAGWLKRAQRYLPHIRTRFLEEGLPEDLIYLPFAESGFNPFALSRSGAATTDRKSVV